MATRAGVKDAFIHAFTDGRDADPRARSATSAKSRKTSRDACAFCQHHRSLLRHGS
jgi:bisphosphoglycerate-independent phosphoglycerate mutase (AlkP superfamily)